MKRLVILLLTLFPINAFCQWQLVHTFPSAPIKMKVVNDRIYVVTTLNGLYISDNDGQTWVKNTNMPDTVIRDFYADADILMATVAGGVLLSFDEGNTWAYNNNGIGNTGIFSVGKAGNNLLCGSFGTFSGDSASINLSMNNGSNWTEQVTITNNSGFPAFATKDSLVVAPSYSSEIFYSHDYGTSFVSIATPFGAEDIIITNSTIVAAAEDGGLSKIRYSANGGLSWQIGADSVSAKDFFNRGDTVYAATLKGFYYSWNGGMSWSINNNGLPAIKQFHAVAAKGNSIWLGHQTGQLYKLDLQNELQVNDKIFPFPLTITPNPTTDIITIGIPTTQGTTHLSIYNGIGQLVLRTSSDVNKITIQTSNLPPGVYLVNCNNSGQKFTGRFVKE